jgi:hypothetical protein
MLGPVAGSRISRWNWVSVDNGRKMLPFVMKRCSSATRESPVAWIIATLDPRSWASMTIDSRPSTSDT